jgi:hypothetical protein
MGFLKRVQGAAEWISDSFSVSGVFKAGKFTGIEAEALTPENGDLVYITATSTVFTSVGFWGYENGSWKPNVNSSTVNRVSVTGTHTIDWNVDTHVITLTGVTNFSFSNLPPNTNAKKKTNYYYLANWF